MSHYVGIDIGGTHTAIGLVNPRGRVLQQLQLDTLDYQLPQDFVYALSQSVGRLPIESQQIAGIGIGAPNGNYFSGSIEHPPNLPWKGIFPLAAMLKESLQLPAHLTNDANAAALGELHFGVAHQQQIKDFVMITLGTGLGAGVVANGQLIYGKGGFAGELGHLLVDIESDRECGCGRRGCLERYASATGLVFTARELLRQGDSPSALRDGAVTQLTSLAIAEAAAGGDSLALQAFDRTAKVLAFALSNAALVTAPQAFVLFGGLVKSGDLLLEPLKKYFYQYLAPVHQSRIQLLPSTIPYHQAAILGAAALARELS